MDGSKLPVLLQNDSLSTCSEILDSLWISNPSTTFHGSTSMVSFEAPKGENNVITPFSTQLDDRGLGGFHQPEKKRRLAVDQVEFLERSFEVENKLEPERKAELAKELSLQPRQVAIWFQNRRARYKTKQLEKDYDILKASYDKLKADCASLEKENDKLKHEVDLLTIRAQSDKYCEPLTSSSSSSREAEEEPWKPISLVNLNVMMEDVNSAKRDATPTDSSSQHSNCWQQQDMNVSCGGGGAAAAPLFPKLKVEEDYSYIDVNVNSSCSAGVGYTHTVVEDESSFWFWPS